MEMCKHGIILARRPRVLTVSKWGGGEEGRKEGREERREGGREAGRQGGRQGGRKKGAWVAVQTKVRDIRCH